MRMDLETASILHNIQGLSQWAARAVVDTDALIEVTKTRPLTPPEQQANLSMQRELLVRLSQQQDLLAWGVFNRAAPWWMWFRARFGRPRR